MLFIIGLSKNMTEEVDHYWMQEALKQAQLAAESGEVPVGALIIFEGKKLASAYNQPISLKDPCAHAEILAIRQAAQQLSNYRLVNTTLYVTLEPCAMCVGAITHARIKRIVFGATDPKSGACGSALSILNSPFLNHKVEVTSNVLGQECGNMLQAFFKARR